MITGKDYKVVYSDGDRTIVKDMKFVSAKDIFLEFLNLQNNKTEFINKDKVIRIEEIQNV